MLIKIIKRPFSFILAMIFAVSFLEMNPATAETAFKNEKEILLERNLETTKGFKARTSGPQAPETPEMPNTPPIPELPENYVGETGLIGPQGPVE
jgi:hypothetical protein